MGSAPRVSINFLALQSQSIEATIWRKRIAFTEAKPADTLCYTLPLDENSDDRGSYLISLAEQAGYSAWTFRDRQNRQFALRYIFEVLAKAAEEYFVGGCNVHRSFQRAVSVILNRTPHGNQEIWLEPYFLAAKGQFGFLIDFHFWKKPDTTSFREFRDSVLGWMSITAAIETPI